MTNSSKICTRSILNNFASTDICVLGGMGPRASIDFTDKIVSLFENSYGDQSHPDILLYSKASFPSRVDSFLKNSDIFGEQLSHAIEQLNNLNPKVISIPCNGAHYWIYKLRLHDKYRNLVLIDEEVAKYISTQHKQTDDWTILGTVVTSESNFYQDTFNKYGLKISKLNEKNQKVISGIIQDVKSNKIGKASKALEKFITNSDKKFILACTELTTLNSDAKFSEEKVIDSSITLAIAVYSKFIAKKIDDKTLYKRLLDS